MKAGGQRNVMPLQGLGMRDIPDKRRHVVVSLRLALVGSDIVALGLFASRPCREVDQRDPFDRLSSQHILLRIR